MVAAKGMNLGHYSMNKALQELTGGSQTHGRPGQAISSGQTGHMVAKEIPGVGVTHHLEKGLEQVAGTEKLVGLTVQNGLAKAGNGKVDDF